jgi:AcrR family transcriptional regulator
MQTMAPKRNHSTVSRLGIVPSVSGLRPKRTRDRMGKKQALVSAALELFATKGYERTTTREIASAAGCAEGLIHRYFKGKAGLLATLIEQRISKESDSDIYIQPLPNLQDEFVEMVEREVERMWESRDLLRVFIPQAIVDPAVGGVMNKALISVHAKKILQRLKNHRSCATLPQDAIEALAQSVETLGFVFGFVRPVLLGQDRVRARKMAVKVAKILVSGPLNSLVA